MGSPLSRDGTYQTLNQKHQRPQLPSPEGVDLAPDSIQNSRSSSITGIVSGNIGVIYGNMAFVYDLFRVGAAIFCCFFHRGKQLLAKACRCQKTRGLEPAP